MEPIEGSETSAFKTQTPGKYPKENILQLSSCFCHHTIGSHCARSETLVVMSLRQRVSSSRESEATFQKTRIFRVTPLSLYESHPVYHKPALNYTQSQIVWQRPVNTHLL